MITLVDMDDWLGIYVDGELKLQGYDIETIEIIEAITGELPTIMEIFPDEIDEYRLPETLSELKELLMKEE